MHGFEFLDQIVLLLAVSVAVIFLFNKVGVPPIVGLIVTGLLIGPSGFQLVTQGEVISVVSEVGVILLLFTIGLEFSFEEIARMRSIVFLAGPLQLIIGAAVIGVGAALVSNMTGLPLTTEGAVLVGLALALSSTAICTKLLNERKELKLPHGKTVTGVLIFQDIAVVPLMLVVAFLDPTAVIGSGVILESVAVMVGVTVTLILGLRYLMPRLAPYLMGSSSPELLILGGLTLCLGTAWITGQAGMSNAIGAFIAGMAIGGSDAGHTFGKALQPIRDAFTSIFFVSIGLLVSIEFEWIHVSVLTGLAVLVVNTVVVLGVLVLLRVNVRTALMSALILAQVGEFSFVLARQDTTTE